MGKSINIVGATILGNGKVSFILDIQTIIMKSSVKTTKENVLQKKLNLKSFIQSLKYTESSTQV